MIIIIEKKKFLNVNTYENTNEVGVESEAVKHEKEREEEESRWLLDWPYPAVYFPKIAVSHSLIPMDSFRHSSVNEMQKDEMMYILDLD